jgi:hypothetical protein
MVESDMNPCETCVHFLPRLRHQGFDWCERHAMVSGAARFVGDRCGPEGRDHEKAEAAE